MKLTNELKTKIDAMSVYTLLCKQRFAPAGDPFYEGESGKYAMNRLADLRSQDNNAYVAASKELGW